MHLLPAAGRKLSQFQGAGVFSGANAFQANQAAAQQLAQAGLLGVAANGAAVTQVNGTPS